MNLVLKYSFFYFIYVFLAGFFLGTIRILFLVPIFGEQNAELLEIPFMVIVCYLVARRIIKACYKKLISIQALLLGVFALAYLLVFEFSLVLWLRDVSFSEYVESKYSIAGIAYVISLTLYAIFPYMTYRSSKVA